MSKASSFPSLAVIPRRRLAFVLVLTTLVACTQDKQGINEVRIRAISGESYFPFSNAGKDQQSNASQGLSLGFDDSPFFSSATYSFFRLGDSVYYAHDQGHRKTGSVGVRNRTAIWQGPLLTLPPLEARPYTASFWVKLINTDRTADVKLVLTQVSDSGPVNMPIAEINVTPRTWHKVEGSFVGTRSDHMHVLRVEVDGADIDYLVDDIMVDESGQPAEYEAEEFAQPAPKSNFVSNGDLEEGLEPWTYQGGKITRTRQHAHSGEYSLLTSERTQGWHAPVMVVKGLEDHTLYRFSIFVRLTDEFPTATVQLTLRQVIDGKLVFTALANEKVTNSGWTEVAGSYSATNFNISGQTSVYLECGNPVASYYVDTLTVEEY